MKAVALLHLFVLVGFFQTIGTKPIAHIDHFTPEMLGVAELVEEVNLDGSGKLVKVRSWIDSNPLVYVIVSIVLYTCNICPYTMYIGNTVLVTFVCFNGF